jgi:Arc/MetJ-type ribon-helix-helix transcriptional regulator
MAFSASLGTRHEKLVEFLVHTGRYENRSEVVRAALGLSRKIRVRSRIYRPNIQVHVVSVCDRQEDLGRSAETETTSKVQAWAGGSYQRRDCPTAISSSKMRSPPKRWSAGSNRLSRGPSKSKISSWLHAGRRVVRSNDTGKPRSV